MVKKITKILLLTTLILALTVNMVSATTVSHTVTPNMIDTTIMDSYEYRSRLEIGGVLYGASRGVSVNSDDNFEVEDEYGFLLGGVEIATEMTSNKIMVRDRFSSSGFAGEGAQSSSNDVLFSTGNLEIDRHASVGMGSISTATNYQTWTAATNYGSSVGSGLGVASYGQESTYTWLGAIQETEMMAAGLGWDMSYIAADARGSPDYGYRFAAGGMGTGYANVETIVTPAVPFLWFGDIIPDTMGTSLYYEANGLSSFSSMGYGESVLLESGTILVSPFHVEVADWYWGW